MSRSLARLFSPLPLLVLCACSDGSGGTGVGGGIDRTAQFTEDSRHYAAFTGEFDSAREVRFLDDHPFIDDLLGDLAGMTIFAKPIAAKDEARRRQILDHGRSRMNKGLFADPTPGTYVYSEGGSPPWVLVDPDDPSDSALFLIREQDGAMIEDDEGELVPAVGEVQFWFEILVLGQDRAEWTETAELRAAPVGQPSATILRSHASWDASGGDQGSDYHISVQLGDRSARVRAASAASTWIGDFMYYAAYYEEGDTIIDSYGASLQFFHVPRGLIVFEALSETRRLIQTPQGEDYQYGSSLEFGFGLTPDPLSLPWLLRMDVDEVDVEEIWEGEVLYRGRRVARIDGGGDIVRCDACVPVLDCVEVWVTWTNDPENPILLCELMQWYDGGRLF
ncbi:MAG TPA: hypothetical protein VGB13_04975 [Candidatus Krumholzibacteria bacterium]|jgi:hypothetical protein